MIEFLVYPRLSFGSIPFSTILIIGQFCLDMKVRTWYIHLDDIQKKNIVKYPYPTVIKRKKEKKGEVLVEDTQMVSQKNNDTRSTPVLHSYVTISYRMIDLLHFLHPVGIQKLTYCNFGMLQIATLIAVYANWDFAMLNGIGWRWAGVIWLYSLIFYLPLDVIKFSVRYIWSGRAWDLVTEQRVRSSLQLCKSGSHN